MTLKEAKEILIEKGYNLKKVKNCHPSQVDYFIDKVLKCAVATVNANGYMVGCPDSEEFVDADKEHNKTVVSDYAQFMKWAHEHYDDFLKSKDGRQVECQDGEPVKGEHLNPALHDSAKQFNDALLDEQAKKISELEAHSKKLNDIIASRNTEIWDLQEKVKKMGKQIAHLNEVIGKRNATIKDLKVELDEKDDLLECYRFSDKNKEDMISGLKKINEKYRHQLADATVNKVNEQALKSAESALVYKDKVIDGLEKKISDAVDLLTESDGFHIKVVGKDPFEDFFKFIREHGCKK